MLCFISSFNITHMFNKLHDLKSHRLSRTYLPAKLFSFVAWYLVSFQPKLLNQLQSLVLIKVRHGRNELNFY